MSGLTFSTVVHEAPGSRRPGLTPDFQMNAYMVLALAISYQLSAIRKSSESLFAFLRADS